MASKIGALYGALCILQGLTTLGMQAHLTTCMLWHNSKTYMWYRRGQTFTIRISKHYYYSVSYKTAVWTTCTQEGYENAAPSFTSGPKSTQSWFNRKSYYPMTQSTCQKEQAKLLCPKISYSNSMNMRCSFQAFMGRGSQFRIRFSFNSRNNVHITQTGR